MHLHSRFSEFMGLYDTVPRCICSAYNVVWPSTSFTKMLAVSRDGRGMHLKPWGQWSRRKHWQVSRLTNSEDLGSTDRSSKFTGALSCAPRYVYDFPNISLSKITYWPITRPSRIWVQCLSRGGKDCDKSDLQNWNISWSSDWYIHAVAALLWFDPLFDGGGHGHWAFAWLDRLRLIAKLQSIRFKIETHIVFTTISS